jgi:DUF1365 family protein
VKHSAIYTGTLHHRRSSPKVHDFRYPVALFYIDLDEVDTLFNRPPLFSRSRWSLLGFCRQDYLAGKNSLQETVSDLILQRTGRHHIGPVRVLTQISYLGFCFNPVTFYYCFNSKEELEFIVSEITNTPWGERKSYVLAIDPSKKDPNAFQFPKDFHISPFMPMNLEHRWRFSTAPAKIFSTPLWVHMEDWTESPQEKIFTATLSLKGKPWSHWELLKTVVRYPLLTFKAVFAIYFQAACLWLKKIPFHPHPNPLKRPL